MANKKVFRNASSQNPLPIELPEPTFDGGKTVMEALRQRKTIREIRDKRLPLQVLSNLFWAACGVNRKKVAIGLCGRTAASASNSQEIDLYVIMKQGAFFYDAVRHTLIPVLAEDLSSVALGEGQPDIGAYAPVRIIYVADIDKLANTAGFQEPGLRDPEIQKSYYFVDTGLIAGNVYLFAASYGLATWFHNCNKLALAKRLNLRAGQRVLFGQTVGYPLKK
jgi:hypothetical protein